MSEVFTGGCLCGAVHVWTKDQVSWFKVDDGLPRFQANSSRVPTKAV